VITHVGPPMPRLAVVLDTNQLQRDWHFVGLVSRLLRFMTWHQMLSVHIPAPVVEELSANHTRQLAQAERDLAKLNHQRKQLGLDPARTSGQPMGFRDRLAELLEESTGISIAPWPRVDHADLVARAVERRPPFDQKGGGYRDALIWATVVDLATKGHDVVLASQDSAFSDSTDALAAQLAKEVEPLTGSVTLVRNLAMWLPTQLPWGDIDIKEAAARARDSQFISYLQDGYLMDELTPEIDELGLPNGTVKARIDATEWDGYFERANAQAGPGGSAWVTYDIGISVDVEADMPAAVAADDTWDTIRVDHTNTATVTGTIDLVITLGVFFEGDEESLESISYRRRDGEPARPLTDTTYPHQLPLFNEA
jgi:hypothetical protein